MKKRGKIRNTGRRIGGAIKSRALAMPIKGIAISAAVPIATDKIELLKKFKDGDPASGKKGMGGYIDAVILGVLAYLLKDATIYGGAGYAFGKEISKNIGAKAAGAAAGYNPAGALAGDDYEIDLDGLSAELLGDDDDDSLDAEILGAMMGLSDDDFDDLGAELLGDDDDIDINGLSAELLGAELLGDETATSTYINNAEADSEINAAVDALSGNRANILARYRKAWNKASNARKMLKKNPQGQRVITALQSKIKQSYAADKNKMGQRVINRYVPPKLRFNKKTF